VQDHELDLGQLSGNLWRWARKSLWERKV